MTVNNTTKDYTFSGTGSISGIGGLTKNGAGKLSVNLANTFTGPVVVNEGTLSVNAVADNGVASALGAGTQLTLGTATANGTLQFTGAVGSTNRNVTLNAGGGTMDVFEPFGVLTLSGPVSGTGNLVKSGAGSLAVTGIIDTTASVIVNDGTLTLSRLNTYTGGTVVNGGSLVLTFGGIAGAIRGELTINAGGTVRDSVKDALGYGANRVSTLNIRGGTYTHTSANNITLWGMNVNMTGGLLESPDAGSTIDVGTGADAANVPTVINTFASPNSATIAGNGVNLRQPNTLITVADGAAAADLVISAPIVQGVVAGITKAGPGTLRLTATNTYVGPTNVQEGALVVAGSLTGSAITVNPSAVLGGGGTVGTVTVLDNGIVAPGEGIGTLTTGALSLNSATKLSFELGVPGVAGGTSNDLLQVGGLLSLDGTLQVLPQPGFGQGVYPLITYTGQLTNNLLELEAEFLALYPGSFVDAETAGSVNLVVVPEPGSAALVVGGLGLLAASRRRRI
jgi:fibronectin-binding autotransporter adhesin